MDWKNVICTIGKKWFVESYFKSDTQKCTGNSKFLHFMSVLKNVRIRSFSGPYFLAFGLNTDQKGSKYGHSSRIEIKLVIDSFDWLEMITVILSFLKIFSLKKTFNRFFNIQKICKKAKCKSFPLRISSVNVTKSAWSKYF